MRFPQICILNQNFIMEKRTKINASIPGARAGFSRLLPCRFCVNDKMCWVLDNLFEVSPFQLKSVDARVPLAIRYQNKTSAEAIFL